MRIPRIISLCLLCLFVAASLSWAGGKPSTDGYAIDTVVGSAEGLCEGAEILQVATTSMSGNCKTTCNLKCQHKLHSLRGNYCY
jgi:hypothetical protein